jgi:hypothetical protein
MTELKRKAYERFNTLFSAHCDWRITTARKPHIDAFGVSILPGEIYLNRRLDPAGEEILKLSLQSMNQLYDALFRSNPLLEGLTDELLCAADARRRKATQGLAGRTDPRLDDSGPSS